MATGSKPGVPGWLEIVVGALTPLAVVLATWWVNTSNDNREALNADRQDRLARLSLVPDFMEALTGTDAKKQLLAVRTVTIVLPEDGPTLLNGIVSEEAEAASNQAIAEARTELTLHLENITKQLYSPASSGVAIEYLKSGNWNSDVLAQALLTSEPPSNSAGLNNVLTVLQAVPSESLSARRDEVQSLWAAAQQSNPANRALADQILYKAGGVDPLAPVLKPQ